jgi:hypothetical protein
MSRGFTASSKELAKLLKGNPHLSVKQGKTAPSAKKKRVGGTKTPNALEKSFGEYLNLRLIAGEIKRYEFEYYYIQILEPDPKYRQQSKMIYTPDYTVWNLDESIDFYEVKGRIMDNTQTRFKLAVAVRPDNKFYFVKRVRGRWSIKLRYPGVVSGELKKKE